MESWTAPNVTHAPPKAGEPPLHRAARLGDGQAIRTAVTRGADLQQRFDVSLDPGAGARPATPLMVAAGSGDGADAATVRLLLELGADPTAVCGADSAATFACTGLGWNYRPGGDAARLRLLLEAGSPLPADPSVANRVLCAAAASGDAERLRILLQRGCDARGHWEAGAARRRAATMQARMRESAAAQPDPFAALPEATRRLLRASQERLQEQLAEQQSGAPFSWEIPLLQAAEAGSAECVRLLLEKGADPQARDNQQRTALFYANAPAVARLLVERGVTLDDVDEFGWSPLTAAVCDGAEAVPRIRALLAAGANVNATHDRGYSVLMSAVGSLERNPDVLRILVAAGADPHAVSELGYNAFHAAIDVNGEANGEASVRDTLGFLRQLGVDIEHRNHRGQTPLARAIAEGTGIEVQVLCELGADPNARCPLYRCGQETCEPDELPLLLHVVQGACADQGRKTAALLRAGADPRAVDADGHPAAAHAVATICAPAPDFQSAFDAFWTQLKARRIDDEQLPDDRDRFIAARTPVLRRVVEEFSAHIPLPTSDAYQQPVREELVESLVALLAYGEWAQR